MFVPAAMSTTAPFDPIEAAIQAIAAGKPVIVTDDEGRENEGDLVLAAEKATPELVNMMIRHARGLICVPMTEPQLKRLGINPMVQQNREAMRTAFTVSVDAAEGITTGISAFDRARTIALLANPDTRADELVQPGHIFPLCARPGGVLERAGHTEAAVDLAALAGLRPAAVICEILNEDGTMARQPELREFALRHQLPSSPSRRSSNTVTGASSWSNASPSGPSPQSTANSPCTSSVARWMAGTTSPSPWASWTATRPSSASTPRTSSATSSTGATWAATAP